MVFIGLDASSSKTGWAIIEANGPDDAQLVAFGEIELEKFKKKDDPLAYLHVLFDALNFIIDEYHPTVCIIENAYNQKNVNTLKILMRVHGVCYISCLTKDAREIIAVNASSARKTVLGEGNLDKAQVCTILEKRFGKVLATKGYDQSDAILLGLCGVKIYEWNSEAQCGNSGRPATKPRNGRSKSAKR